MHNTFKLATFLISIMKTKQRIQSMQSCSGRAQNIVHHHRHPTLITLPHTGSPGYLIWCFSLEQFFTWFLVNAEQFKRATRSLSNMWSCTLSSILSREEIVFFVNSPCPFSFKISASSNFPVKEVESFSP